MPTIMTTILALLLNNLTWATEANITHEATPAELELQAAPHTTTAEQELIHLIAEQRRMRLETHRSLDAWLARLKEEDARREEERRQIRQEEEKLLQRFRKEAEKRTRMSRDVDEYLAQLDTQRLARLSPETRRRIEARRAAYEADADACDARWAAERAAMTEEERQQFEERAAALEARGLHPDLMAARRWAEEREREREELEAFQAASEPSGAAAAA